MAVTLKDVAALAGVSPSTVSRTCSDHPSISEETKERVRQAMAELGYEVNPTSNTSANRYNQRTIGIILPPSQKEAYENAFYLEAIRGISYFCNLKQYTNTIVTGNSEEEILDAIKSMVRSGHVDTFIILYSRLNDSVTNFLYDEGLLYVVIGKANQFANQTIYVDNDNVLAGKEATEYLIQRGHKKIAYLGKDFNLTFSAERRSGYQLALLSYGLELYSDYCIELPTNNKTHFEKIRTLLERPDRPTAAVVSDDIMAFTLKHVCMDLNLSIPEDLSIISFNNSMIARLSNPALTSVDINSFQLGIEAASQMINHIENPNLMATKIIVPHRIIERDSCKTIS